MSANASGQTWKHSRAKGSNLLALLAIADVADEQGRNAWPSPEHLADKTRMTARAMRLILHKLEVDGELVIELNADRRTVKNGYVPPFFLHIRCVFELDGFLAWKSEEISETPFALGRRPKGKVFPKPVPANRKSFHNNRNVAVPESEKPGTAYKEDPSVDPSVELAAAAEQPKTDQLDAFRVTWNEATTEPLKAVETLTKKRRQLIRACLVERTLDAWRDVFARVEQSTFLRGGGSSGFIATFDWLIGSPDPAVKVLEGQYDDRKPQRPRLTIGSGNDYGEWTCTHTPHCMHPTRCRMLVDLEQAKKASA